MREPPSTEQIVDANVRYHDLASQSYDSKWGIDYGEKGAYQVLGKMRKALGQPLHPMGRGLEIGAGTGYFSLNLLKQGILSEATCTDVSPGMLETLAASAERLHVDAETVVCDAEKLPFENNSFDVVFGHAVLHHIPDLEQAFREFRRVLKPGGLVAFCGEPSRTGDRLASYSKRAAPAVPALWRRAVPAPRPTRRGGAAHPGPAAIPAPTARGARTKRRSSSPTSTCTPSRPATSSALHGPAASTPSASAARSWARRGSAGRPGRWSRQPSRRTCRGSGAATRSTAIWRCSGSTRRCSSRVCPRRSSTTC